MPERLSLVCKGLVDRRLLELRREQEAIKLRLFWTDHSPAVLRDAMQLANTADAGPQCACFGCVLADRHPDPRADDDHGPLTLVCSFEPWFARVLIEHGMHTLCGLPSAPLWVSGKVVGNRFGVAGQVLESDFRAPVDGRAADNFFQDYTKVLDADYHFVQVKGLGTVPTWLYASRLWTAASVCDPELRKLASLVRFLDTLDED